MRSDSEQNRMTLAEALQLSNRPVSENERQKTIYLACGFTPLHLVTFLKAHGRLRFPKSGIHVVPGLFDDLIGSVERIPLTSEVLIVVEWADLDPRLGLRHVGGWTQHLFPDIEREVADRLNRIAAPLRRLAQHSVAVVAGPTLPLPPLGFTGPAQDTGFELRLHALVQSCLADLASVPNLRILSQEELAGSSPFDCRLDVGLALAAGFPYSLSHADALARLLIEALFPVEPRKGLITDLDDTLWLGILGEVGVENVVWSLETHAPLHGLYQQYLAALAERGVLLAISSKNDPTLVQQALARADLLCRGSAFFPVVANWGAKSESVAHILKVWNIASKDVVFVDDSPMELAEVSAAFPEIVCVQFPHKNPQGFWKLLQRLRSLFGRQTLQEEDRIRLSSIRAGENVQEERSSLSKDDFLRQLKGKLSLDFSMDPQNVRAFELVNKTNQFNVNGWRRTQSEWQKMLHDPERFLVTVSYEDKFGPLGKIAVISGRIRASTLWIDTWVMSCRAFSRNIEYETLARLITLWSPERIEFKYVPTDRNLPFKEFLENIVESDRGPSPIAFTSAQYAKRRPTLHHEIQEVGTEKGDASVKVK